MFPNTGEDIRIALPDQPGESVVRFQTDGEQVRNQVNASVGAEGCRWPADLNTFRVNGSDCQLALRQHPPKLDISGRNCGYAPRPVFKTEVPVLFKAYCFR